MTHPARPARRRTVQALGAAAIGLGAVVSTWSGAASAAPAVSGAAPTTQAAADCAAAPHEDRNAGSTTVIRDRPVRASYYEECNVRFYGGAVDLHCWKTNARGNVWWFVKGNQGQGWVFYDNLTSRPGLSSDKLCPGATTPAPA